MVVSWRKTKTLTARLSLVKISKLDYNDVDDNGVLQIGQEKKSFFQPPFPFQPKSQWTLPDDVNVICMCTTKL